jgi:hypothetical protein
VERKGLILATPQGEPTWKRGRHSSVIDLTLTTPTIQDHINFCGPEEEWATIADHLPIRISLDTLTREAQENPRFAIKKLDTEGFTRKIETRLQTLQIPWKERAATTEELDHAMLSLQTIIAEELANFCPKSRPSLQARKGWHPAIIDLVAATRRARREWSATRGEYWRQRYKSLSNTLKKEIRKSNRNAWRETVHDLSENPTRKHNSGLWTLSKWSRKKAGKPIGDPHLLALRRRPIDQVTTDDIEKAQILAEKFFPPAATADIDNIETAQQPDTQIPIDWDVTKDTIEETIRRLPNKKAPGPDMIPNEALKKCRTTISKTFAEIASECFKQGHLPACCKVTTTIALRKEGKKDYSLPGSYRPIALENTLGKVLEKILAERLTDAAERHQLLPQSQMGARKNRSTLTATSLLHSITHTAWQKKHSSVVSMLSLDLSGAFDNVNHKRLLHILRQKGLPA